MSWVSWPNSSPMLRSCLSSGITAPHSALSPWIAKPASSGAALDFDVARIGLVIAGVAQAALAAILLAFIKPPAASPFRALEETGSDQSENQSAPNHQRG